MSDEDQENTPKVCEVFEPQAWRKGICKNCFQPPDKHAVTANGVGESPSSTPAEKNTSSGKGTNATSIKDKYEQLERDKHKLSSPPKTLPRSKGQGNIAAFNEMYGSLDRKTGRVPESPSGNIPPPVFPKQYKKDSDGSLKKSKLGSVENINSTEEHQPPDPGMKNKNKFGSMENIADKKKEPLHIPIQKGKFSGSSDNISAKDKLTTSSPLKDKGFELLNKLDNFQNEFKAGVSSKAGPTVIHKQKDGNVDVINLLPKHGKKDTGDSKLKSKFEKADSKSVGEKDNDKNIGKLGTKSKFELKSPTAENNLSLRSLKDSLSKAAEKKGAGTLSDNKLNKLSNAPTESKGILKPKDQIKPSIGEKTEVEQKSGRFNLKDQLKSTSPEKTPASLKDRLKSPPTDSEKKGELPSWKDKLKSNKIPGKDALSQDKLKSPTPESDKSSKVSEISKLANRLKSPPTSEKEKLGDRLKSPVAEETKTTGFSLKDKLKSPVAEKNTPLEVKNEIDKNKGFNLKDQLKSVKDKDSSPTKTVDKSQPDDNKTKGYNRDLLLKSGKKQEVELKSPAADGKSKVPNFKDQLKSSKLEKESKTKTETETSTDSTKAGKSFDLRGGLKKATDKSENETSLKGKPLKQIEPDLEKSDGTNRFSIPKLKSKEESDDIKTHQVQAKSPDKTLHKTVTPNVTDLKKSSKPETNATDAFQKPQVQAAKAAEEESKSDDGFQMKNKEEIEIRKSENDKELDSNKNLPPMSNINEKDFEQISVDIDKVSSDKDDACAHETRARDKSPVHVDTQVFTSSRSKAAGVNSLTESDNLESVSGNQIGFSGLDKNKNISSSTTETQKEGIQNGDISSRYSDKMVDSHDNCPKPSVVYSAEEIEKLKAELINMTERCQNLETENEMLSSTLKKKESSESSLRKQKEEVETSIRGLQNQLKTMEEKCKQLELNSLEQPHSKSNEEKGHKSIEKENMEENDDKLSTREKLMDDMMEENEQLKQEINELKAEMEEMYDSFRDQEAEEFRELQKELEYTAKNCRVLQFKLRKMERKVEQVEHDKTQYEDRLRKLQSQFQDRDAVSHIHSLEDELRVGVLIVSFCCVSSV